MNVVPHRQPIDEVQSTPFSFLPKEGIGGELDARFKIRAPLRCDGIGRLDCAEDLESGMRMAVRWLPLEANGDAAVRACEKLPRHPMLPRIRQVGQVGSAAYVAMDFPDGQLLSTRVGEAFAQNELTRMGGHIADALATIHQQGVFHGELSAESVLLSGERALLWDMPLVIANRLTDRRGEERLMQQLVKTAHYLSPERARGAAASSQGDIYALGAVLAVAAGASLSTGSTLSVVHSVATYNWSPDVPHHLAAPFKELLERMLSPEPQARPSAAEVSQQLLRMSAPITQPEMMRADETTTVEPNPMGRDAPTVAAPALLGLPVVAVPEVEAPPAPQSVALYDNLSVAPDLAASAVILTSEEENSVRGRWPSARLGIALAGVGLLLSVLVLALRPAPKPQAVAAEPAPVVAPRVAEPVPSETKTVEPAQAALVRPGVVPEEEVEDFLAPLKRAPQAKPVAANKMAAKKNANKLSEPNSGHSETTGSTGNDFDFLPNSAPRSTELKRPNF